mgnify:FL=1
MNEKKENVIVNGFFWRFAERCGVQLISAVVSILLARILTPDDYGKVALVTVFNNIMYVLLDCGIGTALVQKKEVDELDYSSAFFFSIVISFVLYGGMFVAAPYLAAFYNDPSMTPIFRGISLTVAVCGIKTIQQAHVTRNMKFQYFFYSAFAGAIVPRSWAWALPTWVLESGRWWCSRYPISRWTRWCCGSCPPGGLRWSFRGST